MQAVQLVARLMFISYFVYNAFEIYLSTDIWAVSFYSAYFNFESWWDKHVKRNLWKDFQYSLPEFGALYPYTQKATIIFGYLYAFGGLLLLNGEKSAALILAIPHFLHSVVTSGPSFAKTQTVFGTSEQAPFMDFMIFATLILITGSDLALKSIMSITRKRRNTDKE